MTSVLRSSRPTNADKAQPSLTKSIFCWIWRILLLLILLLAALWGAFYLTALSTERPVGFQIKAAQDQAGKPITVGIWYPTTSPLSATWAGSFFMQVAKDGEVLGNQLPLIVISHGTGGGIPSHVDLALALAAAGYVVAAPMHSDNYLDMSAVGTPAYIKGRTEQLSATLDFMLNQWDAHQRIAADKIGAYGFSIGAFTVLTAAGAQPDLSSVAGYCANNREFVCDMLTETNSFLLGTELPADINQFRQDSRIKAAVLAAPGLGFTFAAPEAFAQVTLPVQLWHGEQDNTVPYASNTQVIRNNLHNKAEFHLVPHAAHFSFLAPCGLLTMLPLCEDAEPFDRSAFHQQMNAEVIRFYNQQLKSN